MFSSAKALETLSLPGRRVKVLSGDKVEDDALHVVRLWVFGIFPVVWKARISQVTPPYGFTDQAEKSPFKFWRHRHDLIPDGDGTLIRDVVAYIMPAGKLGKAVNKVLVEKDLDKVFAYRHEVLAKKFRRTEETPDL